MAYELLYALVATLVVSLISFIGVVTLSIKDKLLDKITLILVGFSAGALIGGAFLHLIPEALEEGMGQNIFIWVIAGFVIFFVLEKIIHWRHCHKGKCDVHTFTYMNLIGDGAHNFLDGIVIAAAFIVDFRIGVVTTLAVLTHEIPQEFGDFGVLIHGGFSKMKALTWNFLIGLTAMIGAVVGFFLHSFIDEKIIFILPLTAGGFIYIAASDLMPELRKQVEIKKAVFPFLFFLLGIGFMWMTGVFLG